MMCSFFFFPSCLRFLIVLNGRVVRLTFVRMESVFVTVLRLFNKV